MPKYGSQLDTQRIPVKGLVPEASGTAPTGTLVGGQLWVDTSASPPVVKYYDNSSWVRMNGADLPDGTVTNAKIAAGAAIALSKLAVDPLARANHTGTQLAATISDLAGTVQGYRLDQFAAPTGALSLNGQRATNVATPTTGTDAANKQYVDDARAGIAGVKDPVRVALTSNVTLSGPGATLDGVSMVAGDRFLAAGQTTGTENGIYVWNGAASAATRASDANTTGEILDGTLVAVAEGTKAGSQYIQTATPSGAPGAWTQTWTAYTTGGTSYAAGNGLNLTGNTFSVVAADSSISVSGSGVTVGTVPVTKGGTGAATAAAARTNLSALTGYAADVGALTAGTPLNITHNLGTKDVQIATFENTGGARIFLDETVVDTNTISLKADVAYGAAALRVIVQARA